jgi:hypothetical protein
VFNPPSRPQAYAPSQAPASYDQLAASTKASNVAPDFTVPGQASSPGGGNANVPFSFANKSNPAFNFDLPNVGGSASFGGVSVNYGDDPILQQAQAAAQAQIAQAQAAARGAEESALIRYGSPDLVAKVLGNDAQKVANAARGNEFGTMQELGRWNTRALSGIDTNTNRGNLYFSSTRERDRGLQQEDFIRQEARTSNQLQDVLTGIAQNLLGTEQGAQQNLLGAAESAYGRALQSAMAQAQMAAMAQANAGGGGGAPSYGTEAFAGNPYLANQPTGWGAAYAAAAPTYKATYDPNDIRNRRIQ